MAAKGRGGNKTPENLVNLINSALKNRSLRSVSRETGIALAPISRYSKGTSEPTQASLEKLAVYFKKSISYLRGDSSETPADRLIESLEVTGPDFNQALSSYLGMGRDYWHELVTGKLEPEEMSTIAEFFCIDTYWIDRGYTRSEVFSLIEEKYKTKNYEYISHILDLTHDLDVTELKEVIRFIKQLKRARIQF